MTELRPSLGTRWRGIDMIYRTISAMLLCALLIGGAFAQELPSIFGEQREAMQIWPLVGEGLASEESGDPPAGGEMAVAKRMVGPEKSPRRAFLLSVLLPGAGEYYAGSKKKAALFMGIEAVTAGLYFTWKGKGNDIDDEFRQMADAHWDPQTYLAWRSTSRAIRNNSFTHAMPCSLEVAEERFGNCGSSEQQQYYELLGKYDQFVAGWDDLAFVDTGNPVTAYTEIDSVEKVHSELRLDYEVKRDDSNVYLKRASSVAGVILVNHVISAIDAARTARARAAGADEEALERRTRLLFTLHPGRRGQVPMLMAYKPF